MHKKLREMVEKQYGAGIIETIEQADNKDLDRMRYVVKCETCKPELIIYETTLRGAKILFKNVKGFPPIPFHWYIKAARHFVDHKFFHSIRCFVVDGLDKSCVKDFSTEWKAQFAQQRLTLERGNNERFKKGQKTISFEQFLNNELDYLEKQANKAYG